MPTCQTVLSKITFLWIFDTIHFLMFWHHFHNYGLFQKVFVAISFLFPYENKISKMNIQKCRVWWWKFCVVWDLEFEGKTILIKKKYCSFRNILLLFRTILLASKFNCSTMKVLCGFEIWNLKKKLFWYLQWLKWSVAFSKTFCFCSEQSFSKLSFNCICYDTDTKTDEGWKNKKCSRFNEIDHFLSDHSYVI